MSALALIIEVLASAWSLPALATLALCVVLALAVRPGPAVPSALRPARRALALRRRALRTAFLRLRDPGAPGRPRPRAPGTAAAAA